MANPFINFPLDASWDIIGRYAYKVLKARRAKEYISGYDFFANEANRAVYDAELLSLAEDAMRVGLYKVKGMTKERVASMMENLVTSAYWAEYMQKEIEYRKDDPNYPDWYS